MNQQRAPLDYAWNAVRVDELAAVAQRRKLNDLPGDAPEDSLVGLALSGGGVRSGAFCLGVIQMLYQRGILRFVDYLSTVSGGGYAGAYLSSAALAQHSAVQAANAGRQPAADIPGFLPFHLPIAELQGGAQRPRMLRFIFGGSYLRSTGLFLNRYLIGLLLIWTFAFSGLLAVTAFTAWLFRCLDHVESRVHLGPLGFEGDVRLAFFPAFLLLIAWVVAWGVSYFRDRDAATGTIARWLFYALSTSAAIAVAALLGTGDIAVTDFMGLQKLQVPGSVKLAIFTSIVVALLPYVSPKRLLQSGTSPKNAAEKYIFFIATRGLLIGVPFVVFALLAQEDISGWNEDRDSRLTSIDITDWTAESPIWRQVLGTPSAASVKPPSCLAGEFWPRSTAPDAARYQDTRDSINVLFKKLREAEQMERTGRFNYSEHNHLKQAAAMERDSVSSGHFSFSHLHDDIPQKDAEISHIQAWGLLFQWLTGRNSDDRDNALRLCCTGKMETLRIRKEITSQLNERLKDRNLYRSLLPDCVANVDTLAEQYWPRVQGWHPNRGGDSNAKDDGKTWARQLLFYRSQAEALPVAPPVSAPTLTPTTAPAPAPAPAQDGKSPTGLTEVDAAEVHAAEVHAAEVAELARMDSERRVLEINRQLLKAWYGDLIADKSVVYSGIVLVKDQETRLRWFRWSLLVFVISGATVNLNATSWHGFYSRRLGDAWIDPIPGLGTRVPFSQLETTRVGAPYHLVSGCVQLLGRQESCDRVSRDQFLFSQRYCGCESLGYKPTSQYMDGRYTLEDGIAVSGAAVTPVQSGNPLILALFFLLNVRLGQWLENPGRSEAINPLQRCFRYVWSPIRIFSQLPRPAEKRSICFVSDGGHFENLGIFPLLQRRCRLIIAFDAGEDAKYDFADFHRLKTLVRMQTGITLETCTREPGELSLETLTPSADHGFSRSHYLVARILYPDAQPDCPSWLVYVKSSLTGDEPAEILSLRKHSEFPHDPTADQFYDPRRFDAYRRLGQHITGDVLSRLPASFESHNPQTCSAEFISRLVGDVPRARSDAAPPIERPDSPVQEFIRILNDPQSDSLARGYAAREIMDQASIPNTAIQALVDTLSCEDMHLAAVAGQCITKVGTHALPHLRRCLDSDSQPFVQHVVELIRDIFQQAPAPDRDTIAAVCERLKHLCDAHRHELSRVAMINALRLGARMDPAELAASSVAQTLQYLAANDISRSVRRLAHRVLEELHAARPA